MNAHSKIVPQVVVADDGTITLPASVTEQAGWAAGMKLDLWAGLATASLSTPSTTKKKTAEEVFARLREINPYRGPMITDEEMHAIVEDAAVERYRRSLPPK